MTAAVHEKWLCRALHFNIIADHMFLPQASAVTIFFLKLKVSQISCKSYFTFSLEVMDACVRISAFMRVPSCGAYLLHANACVQCICPGPIAGCRLVVPRPASVLSLLWHDLEIQIIDCTCCVNGSGAAVSQLVACVRERACKCQINHGGHWAVHRSCRLSEAAAEWHLAVASARLGSAFPVLE